MTYVAETVAVRGLAFRVHRWEPETTARASMLLLHGFLDAGATWDLVAPQLAREGYRVLAPDLRGFGESEWVPASGYYHFPDYVADVDALSRALLAPSDSLVLVGHSMGATVAALFAGARPERVAALALLEGVGPPAGPPRLTLDRTRAWLRQLEARAESTRPARGKLASLDDAVLRLALHHPTIPSELLASRARLLTRQRDDGLQWAHDPLHRTVSPTAFHVEAFSAFLAEVKAPTLFVSGGPDGWHPEDEQARLAALGGPLERAEIPTAGHMLHWTAPDELARVLAGFASRAVRHG